MAVKEKNIFSGGNYMNDIKHDVLTGRMFTQDVIINTIKPLRAELGVENNATAKDDVSFEIRKKLAEMGIQQIESIYGHFAGIDVSVRPAGKGVAREAKIRLVDTETGVADRLILNLSSPSGQMLIQKFKQVQPGELVDVRMFTVVSDTNADGTPKLNADGVQTTYANHLGAITRENGEKITLDNDAEVLALRAAIATEVGKQSMPEMKTVVRSSMLVEASLACANAIAEKMKDYKFDGVKSANQVHQHAEPAANSTTKTGDHEDVFNSDDVSFGDDPGFDPGKKGNAPRA